MPKHTNYQRFDCAEWMAEHPVKSPLPPEDPDCGDPDRDITNGKRAGFAAIAIDTYQQITGSDAETAIKDLLGDLQHFCDRHGLDFEEELEGGREMYKYEIDGKEPAKQ